MCNRPSAHESRSNPKGVPAMTEIYNSHEGELGRQLQRAIEDAKAKVYNGEPSDITAAEDAELAYLLIPTIGEGPQAMLDWAEWFNYEMDIDNLHAYVAVIETHPKRSDFIAQAQWSEGLRIYNKGDLKMSRRTDMEQYSKRKVRKFLADIDAQMTTHNKREIVFRGLSMDMRSNGRTKTVPLNLQPGDWFTTSHFSSASTVILEPSWFSMTWAGDHVNSTMLEIEIEPNVKTIVYNEAMQEIIIERGAKFEVLESHRGNLHVNGEELKQYTRVRAHPPNTHHGAANLLNLDDLLIAEQEPLPDAEQEKGGTS